MPDAGRPSACINALGVPVGLAAQLVDHFTAFPRCSRPAEVEITEADPVLASGLVTRAAVEGTALFCVHAGVVSTPAGALALPGPSGLGKSTLVAALVQAGLGYMSDEVLALDRATAVATSFPRPMTLDVRSLDLLDIHLPMLDAGASTEAVVPVEAIGHLGPHHASVTAIVLARRQPGAVTVTVTDGSSAEAASALIRHSFNHYRDPASSVRTVALAARTARTYIATYSDARQLAMVLAQRLGLG